MKRFIILFTLAIAILSCTTEREVIHPQQTDNKLTFTISGAKLIAPQTKSTQTMDEVTVSDLTLYLFNGTSPGSILQKVITLDNTGLTASQASISGTVQVPNNVEYGVAFVANRGINKPRPDGVVAQINVTEGYTTLADFSQSVTNSVNYQSSDKNYLLMVSNNGTSPAYMSTNHAISGVVLERAMARIDITLDNTEAISTGRDPFVLRKITMVDTPTNTFVVAGNDFNSASPSFSWTDFVKDDLYLGASSQVEKLEQLFYPYEGNLTPNSKIVVSGTIGDEIAEFEFKIRNPVTKQYLEKMERNTLYLINIKYNPRNNNQIDMDMSIVDWNEVLKEGEVMHSPILINGQPNVTQIEVDNPEEHIFTVEASTTASIIATVLHSDNGMTSSDITRTAVTTRAVYSAFDIHFRAVPHGMEPAKTVVMFANAVAPDHYQIVTFTQPIRPAKTFNITFDSNGGSYVETISYLLEGAPIPEPYEPTSYGNRFDGWYRDNTFAERWDFYADVVKESITLYAKWEPNKYTITFNTQGGLIIDPIHVQHGWLAPLSEFTTKDGYIFAGWYLDPGTTQLWNHEGTPVTSDLTVYAKWDPITYSVTFYSQGGSVVDSQYVAYGYKITAPYVPTKAGYIFEGWYKEPETINRWIFSSNSVYEDIALYAKWGVE